MGKISGIEEFVKVVQMGSFSAAAKALDMPVSTVSGKVAALEKRLGITLIHRTTRKLHITEVGRSYVDYCMEALRSLEDAEHMVSQASEKPKGLIRITAPSDIGHHILPPIVNAYMNQYPNVRVELLLTNKVVDLVKEGVDLAIRAGKVSASTLIVKQFLNFQFMLLANPEFMNNHASAKGPEELPQHAVIGIKALGKSVHLVKGNLTQTIPINPKLLLDDMEAVKSFALQGYGIGLLPTHICKVEIEKKELLPVLPEWSIQFTQHGANNISFVYPPQKYLSPNIKAFIELASTFEW